ncbi:DUF2157 domain-containing protein [Gelidibacter sp.]|uniref:DUF2157 domain-containing protein n=1 Tax=Gelidibacter sp. TaxID=2018083 RepID=UPI002D13ADB4|nr:DUF2157 domain-containing protein [Gelidibacter sp.]HUH28354.1 DUF2157 domain-containing protein [Gelidibacter sp.]
MKTKVIEALPELVKNNVISEEVALKIREFYDVQQTDSPNKLFTLFGVMGALLVGLGIILIVAHNWEDFPRSLKTIFAFLPLLIGQVVAGFTILKSKSTTWREAAGTFLFFAVGSSIALVSQIYNIPGDLSTYMLTWILLCMPLVYLLKSNAVAILHLVFSTVYAVSLGYGFNGLAEVPWWYLLVLGFLLPYYFQMISRRPQAQMVSIFNWLVPLSLVLTLGAFLKENGELGYLMYIVLFGIFYNIGKLTFFKGHKLRWNGYLILGSVGTVVTLMILSFIDVWNFDRQASLFSSPEFFMAALLFCIALGILIYVDKRRGIDRSNLYHYAFVLFTILFFVGMVHGLTATILVNILVLLLGLMTIKLGTDKSHFGILNYGLLIITALIVCRFFDTDMSYIIRGLLFVGVGIGFFLSNYIMLKRRNKSVN